MRKQNGGAVIRVWYHADCLDGFASARMGHVVRACTFSPPPRAKERKSQRYGGGWRPFSAAFEEDLEVRLDPIDRSEKNGAAK